MITVFELNPISTDIIDNWLNPVKADSSSMAKARKRIPPDRMPIPTFEVPVPATEDGSTVESSPPMPPLDPRSIWINKSYNTTILRQADGTWIEIDNSTNEKKWNLREVEKTREYVELANDVRSQVWRLYPTRMDIQAGDKWQWLSTGNWKPPIPK